MLKIENVEVMGWEAAIRGMRNPMNSWEKSDSGFEFVEDPSPINPNDELMFVVGENDLDLMKRLRNAGTDHRKFMRMIVVYADVTAPLYWWKEFDTYKVGSVANSCSTMHKIHSKRFERDDFSNEHLISDRGQASFEIADSNGNPTDIGITPASWLNVTISLLNAYREKYLETNDKTWWWQLIQSLPSSYNQRRTIMLNYEVLANMYKSRKNHKLDEWVEFCKWIETLPYADLITEKETAENESKE